MLKEDNKKHFDDMDKDELLEVVYILKNIIDDYDELCVNGDLDETETYKSIRKDVFLIDPNTSLEDWQNDYPDDEDDYDEYDAEEYNEED